MKNKLKIMDASDWGTLKDWLFELDRECFGLTLGKFDGFYSDMLRSRRLLWIGGFSENDLEFLGHIMGIPLEENADDPHLKLQELDPANLGKGNTMYIETMAVFERFRNQGLGTKLYENLALSAKERGFKRIAGHFDPRTSLNIVMKNSIVQVDNVKPIHHYFYGNGRRFDYVSGRILGA